MRKGDFTKSLLKRWAEMKQFLYGLTGYEFARYAVATRHELESIFMIVTLGDLIGVPVLPPIYSLRLLPYVAPEIGMWKRCLARRKEFWEREEYDLHGI
ncbi:MAG: hypothetical protein A2W66_02510 [Deltaproteobacteria bacterium RIFCSPLOWO2_02_56_12]|nr:MAG: hypothetical protein A2W66_02510 [Deltaproteobacteria bacterium RIFCSPLOWO2_02_56_12]OGQ65517.1 MAG: hypothetical protein A2W73_01330 [Deltaproteobacteria bacterium RIFCSPLOWO2_12_55_13]